MKTQIVLSLAAALTLLACTTKEVPRTVHEGPQLQDYNAVPSKEADVAAFQSLKVAELETQLTAAKTAEDYSKIMSSLRGFALNSAYTEAPQYQTDPKLVSALRIYNKALLEWLKIEKAADKKNNELKNYSYLLFSGCNADFAGCRNLSFFASDALSTEIVQEMARAHLQHNQATANNCTLTILPYYRYLRMAYTVRPTRARKDDATTDLQFMYMKKAYDYSQCLAALDLTDPRRDELRQHSDMFANLAKRFIASPKNTEFKEFVEGFNPWSFSRTQRSTEISLSTDQVLRMAAQHYLYENSNSGILNPRLMRFIQETQAESLSFTQILRGLERNYPSTLKALKLDAAQNPLVLDEYFYIVDRLIRGDFAIEDAEFIWKNSRRDVLRFEKTMLYYLKITTLQQVITTNEKMGSLFTDASQNPDALFSLSLGKSGESVKSWSVVKESIKNLAVFVERNMAHSTEELKFRQSSLSVFQSFDRNISLISTYPNIMALGFFTADRLGTFEIGNSKFTPDAVIQSIIEGQVPPIYTFSSDTRPLNSVEILYSIYFGGATGLFETYEQLAQTTANNFTRAQFINKTLEQYLGKEEQSLRTNLDEFKSLFESNTDYKNFLQNCQKEKNGNQNYTVEVTFEDLSQMTFTGNGEKGLSVTGQNVYSNINGPGNVYGDIRDKVLYKHMVMKSMLDLVQTSLKATGVSDSQIAELLNPARQRMQQVLQLVKTYYDITLKQHHEVSECLNIFEKIERDRQFAIYDLESEHLKQVYQALKELDSLPADGQSEAIQNLNQKFQFTTEGLDEILAGGSYRYSKTSFKLRVRNWLAQMQPQTDVTYLEDELSRREDYTQSVRLSLYNAHGKVVSESEFISSGLKKLNGKDGSFVDWILQSNKIDLRMQKVTTLANLYSLGIALKEKSANRIQTSELLAEQNRLLNLIHINEKEQVYLPLMGLERKLTREDIAKVLPSANNSSEPTAAADYVYSRLADNFALIRMAFEFYNSSTSLNNFLFSLEPSVAQDLKTNFTPLVTLAEGPTRQFESEIKQEAKTPQYLIIYDLSRNSTPFKSNALVHPIRLNGFDSRMGEFHRNTKNDFQSTVTQPRQRGGN